MWCGIPLGYSTYLLSVHMTKLVALVPAIVLLLSLTGKAQYYYRIECDISIKQKVEGGEGMLILGRAYYDKSKDQMVYDIRFPEREVWVIRDTSVYIHSNGQIQHIRAIDQYNQSTIFHKILEGNLKNYGLEESIYRVSDIERSGDMVITRWKPSSGQSLLGDILTSTIDDALYGVVFKNSAGKIIGRQLFREYTLVQGLHVPTEIIQVFYRDNHEEYQIFTLSNIRINNPGNQNMYHFRIADP